MSAQLASAKEEIAYLENQLEQASNLAVAETSATTTKSGGNGSNQMMIEEEEIQEESSHAKFDSGEIENILDLDSVLPDDQYNYRRQE